MTRRLLVVTSTYPRWDGDTHPRFVHDLCANLVARHDAEVVVLAPTSHGARRSETVDGVQVERFAYWRDRPNLLRDGPALPTLKARPTTAFQVPTYVAAMGAAIRGQLRDHGPWDAIHAHWLLPQATIAALARGPRSSQGRPRLVATSHGSDVLATGRAMQPPLRWTLRHLDAVTGVSTAVVDRLRALGIPGNVPATVAPMGIDTGVFRPSADSRASKRAELGLDVDRPLVLCAGRLVAGKGVDVLLHALPAVVARHPELRVAIVGHGAARSDLERQAARLGLADRVGFHGFVPQTELARWFAAADVTVSPSRSEGFGLVGVEALASGCPLIVSDLPALRDVIGPASAARTVPVGDVARLSQALLDQLGERETSRDLAIAHAPDLAGRFGWDAATDRYAEVLFP